MQVYVVDWLDVLVDASDLPTYLAANYLSLSGGGVVTGELFIASGGALYLYDPIVDTDQELTVVDGELLVGGVAVGGGGSTTDASLLTTGTLDDARLSANVPLKNAASNAFTGPIDASSFRQVGNTTQGLVPSGGVWYLDGTGGFRYRDTSAGYATRFQVDNSGNVIVSGTLTIGTGVSIVRNATGPTLETRAAGGLKVCNADGSAVGPVECSGVSNSATGVSVGHATQGWAPMGPVRNAMQSHQGHWSLAWHGMAGLTSAQMVVGGHLGFTAAFGAGGAVTTRLTQASSGVLAVLASTSTADSTTLGSLNLAMLTASGMIIANGGIDLNSSAVIRRSSFFVWRNTAVGKHSFRNWVETSGVTLDYSTDGVLNLRNRDDSGAGNLICGWVDAAHRPYTFAGLPLASAAQDKTFVCTDSTLAMTSANYGSTPSGGGSNRVRVFSNGTAWLLA
jgi:hypothetical protein